MVKTLTTVAQSGLRESRAMIYGPTERKKTVNPPQEAGCIKTANGSGGGHDSFVYAKKGKNV